MLNSFGIKFCKCFPGSSCLGVLAALPDLGDSGIYEFVFILCFCKVLFLKLCKPVQWYVNDGPMFIIISLYTHTIDVCWSHLPAQF